MASCKLCIREDDDQMILCDNCEKWFHYKCALVDAEMVEFIKEFFCSDCEDEHELKTTWEGLRLSRQEKARNYFEVRTIRDYKNDEETGMSYLVSWKGYPRSEDTWEPAKNLNNCNAILKKFHLERGIMVPKIRPLVGASDGVPNNERNWVSIGDIIKRISILRNMDRYKSDLEVEEWNEFGCVDRIYIMRHDFHCYVLLHLPRRNMCYIADGSNKFLENVQTRFEIRRILRIPLQHLRFEQQTKADHCGSSAVLIALEFMRGYRRVKFPQTLKATPSVVKKVTDSLHRHKSELIENPFEKKDHVARCEICSLTLRGHNRNQKMALHIRMMHKREEEE